MATALQTRLQACDCEACGCTQAQDNDRGRQPVAPVLVEEGQDMRLQAGCTRKRQGQNPPAPPRAPVVVPQCRHPYPHQRGDGWGEHRQIVGSQSPATLKNTTSDTSHVPQSTRALSSLRLSGRRGRPCQLRQLRQLAATKPTTASGISHPICPASCRLRSLKGPGSPTPSSLPTRRPT